MGGDRCGVAVVGGVMVGGKVGHGAGVERVVEELYKRGRREGSRSGNVRSACVTCKVLAIEGGKVCSL